MEDARDIAERMMIAHKAGYEAGVEAERKRIVAWLRDEVSGGYSPEIDEAADKLEQGET